MRWLLLLLLTGTLPLWAEKDRPVVFQKSRSDDWLTSQNLTLGESATLTGKLQGVQDTSDPLTLRSGPATSWQKGYQFTYQQKLASFLELEFSPQFLFGTQSDGSPYRSSTEADYFKRHEVTNLRFKPIPQWTVRGFSDSSEWQSLDTVNTQRQQAWGFENQWNATKWTKFRTLHQQGEQEQKLSATREQTSRFEFELTQKLGETPFQMKILKGWEDQLDASTARLQRSVPKTEGVLSYAPSNLTAVSMGLRVLATDEPMAAKNTAQQTLFGEWSQGLTPVLDLRFQASHDSIRETEAGAVSNQLERTHFVFGPQMKLNEAFRAKMEFRITDEQNRQQPAAKVDQGVSLSIQGKF